MAPGPDDLGGGSRLLINYNEGIDAYELIVPNTDITLTFAGNAGNAEFGVEALATFMTEGTEAIALNADAIFEGIDALGFELDAAFFDALFTTDYIVFGDTAIPLLANAVEGIAEAIEAAGEALLLLFA